MTRTPPSRRSSTWRWLFGALAARPVGDHVERDATGAGTVIVPGRRFGEYLGLGLGLIRRYGAGEPTVVQALLQLLHTCAVLSLDDPARWSAIQQQAQLLVTAAEQAVRQAEDLAPVYAEAEAIQDVLAARHAGRLEAGTPVTRPPTAA